MEVRKERRKSQKSGKLRDDTERIEDGEGRDSRKEKKVKKCLTRNILSVYKVTPWMERYILGVL